MFVSSFCLLQIANFLGCLALIEVAPGKKPLCDKCVVCHSLQWDYKYVRGPREWIDWEQYIKNAFKLNKIENEISNKMQMKKEKNTIEIPSGPYILYFIKQCDVHIRRFYDGSRSGYLFNFLPSFLSSFSADMFTYIHYLDLLRWSYVLCWMEMKKWCCIANGVQFANIIIIASSLQPAHLEVRGRDAGNDTNKGD